MVMDFFHLRPDAGRARTESQVMMAFVRVPARYRLLFLPELFFMKLVSIVYNDRTVRTDTFVYFAFASPAPFFFVSLDQSNLYLRYHAHSATQSRVTLTVIKSPIKSHGRAAAVVSQWARSRSTLGGFIFASSIFCQWRRRHQNAARARYHRLIL